MKSLIVGGAGFIGSHMAMKLLQQDGHRVVIYDNFTSGTDRHLQPIRDNPNLEIIRKDVKDLPELTKAAHGVDVIYHFASNPDISKAITQPDIDFWEGTYLTNNVVEAARQAGVKRIIYASGSGVYGDTGDLEVDENYSPLRPISTYGASKLAGEALLCSYCEMFGLQASGFRFANVVGPKQTHGVGYDFIRKLRENPRELAILGDGSQSKSYLHVDDVLRALETVLASNLPGFTAFNVATGDAITVREIADIACAKMKLENVNYRFGGGKRGWKGDVPVIRLSSKAIRNLGWNPHYKSAEAISASLDAMLAEQP
jgi:UDP-glucose 4-epimerase